ncbi:MAG: GNAT family protein [Candidatus Dormiibacterota bacterium]
MLQTEGVVLTAVEPEDIPLIVLWRNMPEVYTGFIEHAPLSTAAQAAFQAGLTPEGTRRLWLINARGGPVAVGTEAKRGATPVKVGTVGIMDLDWRNRRCEFGPIFIGALEYRGRGIAKEAEILVLDYCFNHLGLHKVIAHVPDSNAGVIALHEAAGFRRDIVLRDHIFRAGRFEGLHLLSCLASEFRERFPAGADIAADSLRGWR